MLINCTSKPEDILIKEDAKPIILKAAMQKRVAQDNEFAFKLLKNTIQKTTESNVFVSPLSVSIAFGDQNLKKNQLTKLILKQKQVRQ